MIGEEAMNATLIVALISTFGSVLLLVSTKYLERRAVNAQANRDRKIPIYEDIFKAANPVMAAITDNTDVPPAPELTQKVACWASTDVLISYVLFRLACEDRDATKVAIAFSDMVLAVRKDLGYRKTRRINDTVKDGIGSFVLLDSRPVIAPDKQNKQTAV